MPQAAMSKATICHQELWRFRMWGKPANNRLAANAPMERKTARGRDFCRKRKIDRRGTTFHCIARMRPRVHALGAVEFMSARRHFAVYLVSRGRHAVSNGPPYFVSVCRGVFL